MFDDSLPPYYRLINVIWLPFLKIKKFRVPSLKIRKFRVISCSCFLIEMKFISKSVCCLVMENVAFVNPHLRKIIFKIYIQKIQEKSWNHFYNILFSISKYLKIWKFSNFWKANPPLFRKLILNFQNMFWILPKNIFCGDEDWKMLHFPLLNSTQSWIWISFLSKSMNRMSP